MRPVRTPIALLATALCVLPVPAVAKPVAAAAVEVQAAGEPEAVIGTRVVPPFVMRDADGSYTGLTVHLWEHVARELGITYRFEARDLEGLIAGVADGSLSASAAALTVTAEREAFVDFTHPFLVTGLGIAVPYREVGLGGALLALASPEFLWIVFLLVVVLLACGLLLWMFERRRNAAQFGGSAAEGIGSGFWWAAVTMTTVGYGDKAPTTVGGRVVGFVWMFTAVIVISFFTASIASSLTVTRLDSRVSGPQDLPFVRVGALQASAALAYLDGEDVRATPFATLEGGLGALVDGTLDAFVHDAPILRYTVREDFANGARVLPNSFAEQYYGIVLPLGSARRNEMNRVLLEYVAGEEWDRLKRRYLGDP